MSSQKYVFGLAFVIAALVAINTIPTASGTDVVYNYAAPANKSHHMIVGYRMPGDKLVHRENIVKNSSWMKVVTVEKTFFTPQYLRITLLQALDQKTNGNGAYASIIKGGPGNNNVTLKFKSQRGHGINFIVELYAR